MLSIKGLLGPEEPMGPTGKRSLSGEQQPPPLPRSSPESQTPRKRKRGGGDSPSDRAGLGVLSLAATSVEYATRPEGSQPPPPPQSLTAATKMASPQTFTQQGTESTPSPPLSRRRRASGPTPTPTPTPGARQKRAPRPQYTKEQEDFIWFCRDDLAMSWRKVVKLYNDHWHPFEVEPHIRSESGLQSRYYRILDFPVKIRKRKEPSRPDLGLIPSTNRRYPWMGVLPDRRDRESSIGGIGMVPGVIGMGGEGGGDGSPSRKRRKLSSSDNETIRGGPHAVHYNTPTRTFEQAKLCPSNRLTNIDQPGSGGYESPGRTSLPTSPHQQRTRCTYPRPPDPQTFSGTPMPPDPVLPSRRQRARHGEDEGEPGAERERRRRLDTGRVDENIMSVTSLCR